MDIAQLTATHRGLVLTHLSHQGCSADCRPAVCIQVAQLLADQGNAAKSSLHSLESILHSSEGSSRQLGMVSPVFQINPGQQLCLLWGHARAISLLLDLQASMQGTCCKSKLHVVLLARTLLAERHCHSTQRKAGRRWKCGQPAAKRASHAVSTISWLCYSAGLCQQTRSSSC